MTQPDLFSGPYNGGCGWKARDTAKAAAEAVKPTAATLRARALELLRREGPRTADDVARRLDEHPLAMRPRLSELAALGLIEDTRQRGRNESGKRAIIWRAVP